MKFKRWGGQLTAIIIVDSLLLIVTIDMLRIGDIKGALYCLLMGLGWVGLIWLCAKGLFYDTVYYDEKGIKLVAKEKSSETKRYEEKIYEYPWEEIRRLDPKVGGKGGRIGWFVVPNDGNKFFVSPMTGKFIKFVRKTHPEIKIR